MLRSKLKNRFILVITAFSIFAGFFSFQKAYALEAIDVILKSDDYSYLPDVAKEFIRKNYEENNSLILTEKNQKSGELYLNPEYVRYLELSDEEKAEVDVIPMVYALSETKEAEPTAKRGGSKKAPTTETTESTVYNEYLSKDEVFPETFDLRNVNGRSYITPLKNQGSYGLCWDFAFNEQAESFLMRKNNQSYNALTTQQFSIRQMDYATSTNGFNNYVNEDGSRLLTKGGNFYMASWIAANGLALAPESFFPYTTSDTNPREMAYILNYNIPIYELNRAIMLPKSALTQSDYVKYAKDGIMRYGGAEVSTGSPTGSCGSDWNGRPIIFDEVSCQQDGAFGAHSMQIIGWDDNYSWVFCRFGSMHLAPNVYGNCDSGERVSGVGAWLVRNSWGVRSDGRDYIYIAYDSTRSTMQINFSTDMSLMSERTWDNNYHRNHWYHGTGSGYSDSITVTRKVAGAEKLELIKILSYSYNTNYTITVSDGVNNRIVFDGTVIWPGVFTIDVSDQNIILDSEAFTVSVTGSKVMIKNAIGVFTSNVTDTPRTSTDDIEINVGIIPQNSTHDLKIMTYTKNIPSGATPTYSLWNGSTDITSGNLTVTNNGVGANKINAYVAINTNIGSGDFTLKICYQNSCDDVDITISGISVAGGTGVDGDPYLISKESEFSAMRAYPYALFELSNDIELTKPFMPIGTAMTPFTGKLSGGGHKISNLKVTSDDECAGMFGYMQGGGGSYYPLISLFIDNMDIKGSQNAGLIGCFYNPMNTTPQFKDIYIIGGSVESTGGNAGALIGKTTFANGANSLSFQYVFSSADVSGQESSGIFGSVGPYGGLTLKFMQNAGTITAKAKADDTYTDYHNQIVGKEDNTDINLTNYIASALIKRGKFYENEINNYKTGIGWTTRTVDGVARTPLLAKVANASLFEFSTIDTDIELKQGETMSLMNYIEPIMDAARVTYTVTDSGGGAVEVIDEKNADNNYYPEDIKIVGVKPGVATIHLLLQYDGNERDMTVTVVGPVVDTSDGVVAESGSGVLKMHEGGITDVTSHLEMSNDAEVTYMHFDKNSNEAVYDEIRTGDTVRMSVDDSWYYDYLMVVSGDVNGDGDVSSGDYVDIKKHIMTIETIAVSTPYFLAADLNDDTLVSSMDYIKVRNYIMNGGDS